MTKVGFFTAVSFGNQSKSCTQSAIETVDSYFYLGGKKACVIPGHTQQDSEGAILTKDSPAFLITALKVISYLTVAIPVILLIAKAILRSIHSFHIIDAKQKLEERVDIAQATAALPEGPPASPLPSIPEKQDHITEIDEEGNTQLHRAILLRQRENEHPRTVLEHTSQEIIRFLKLGLDPTIQNLEGNTVLHLIADLPYWSVKHDELVKVLLNYGAKANVPNKQAVTAFHRIISAKPSAAIIETLITDGLADVNAQDNRGDAALHRLACSDRSLGSKFDVKVATVLLRHGAKVDMPNNEGNTPLHIAITTQQDVQEATRFFLCECHAAVNAQNNDGDTPLHLLARYNQWDKWNHRDTIQLLLSQGADKTITNKMGELPIHKAYKRSGSEVIDLLQTNVDLETVDSNGQTPLHLAANNSRTNIDEFRRILEKSKNIMAADKWGNTPLHYAASSGFYEAAELLIAKKATADTTNKEGNSPLYLAVKSLLNDSYRQISSHSKLEQMKEIITVLHSGKKGSSEQIRFKIDPRFIILHDIALRRIINLLLDKGSNPYQTNEKGESTVEHCFNWAKMFSTFRTEDDFSELRQSLA